MVAAGALAGCWRAGWLLLRLAVILLTTHSIVGDWGNQWAPGETSGVPFWFVWSTFLGGGMHHIYSHYSISYLKYKNTRVPGKGCNVKITIGLGPTALLSAVYCRL